MDQHFLKNTKSYQKLLLSKGLGSQKIIEIGVGQGELTTLIHACNPTLIKGYEIDKSLRPATLDKLELIYQDILTADLSFLTSGDYYLISNPPYCLLPEIKERIINILNLAKATAFSLRIFGLNFLVALRREGLLSLSANQKSRLKSAWYNPVSSTKMSIDTHSRGLS